MMIIRQQILGLAVAFGLAPIFFGMMHGTALADGPGSPPSPPSFGPGPGPGQGPGPGFAPPPGVAPPGHVGSPDYQGSPGPSGITDPSVSRNLALPPGFQAGQPGRRRTGLLTHDDALNARKAGEILSLKDVLAAVKPGDSKVLEVKLFSYTRRAVYRIKLRDGDGTIRTLRINALTGEPASLF